VISGRLAAMGITSVQDASIQNGLKTWKKYAHYRDTGIMKQRLTMMLGSGAFMKEQYRDIAGEDDWLRVNGVKIVLHEASGELFPPGKELRNTIMKIHRAGMQAAVHAIEEHVIETAADTIAVAIGEYPVKDSRHRIEHCLVCPPRLARKLAETGVMIVTQPNFVYYNGDRYLNTVPDEQMRYMYPIKTLMDAGLVVAAGSDGPVVPQDPIKGIYTAVTRRTEQGNRLLPHEGINLDSAIKMYTLNAACAAREEKQKGSITPGKLADLVILDRDITRINPEEIKDVNVDTAIIGGEVVF
jgi:predicted amidohydrolase YtcJ